MVSRAKSTTFNYGIKISSTWILLFFIIGLAFVDAWSKYFLALSGESARLTLLIRSAFLLFLIIGIFLKLKKSSLEKIGLMALIFVSYVWGQILFSYDIPYEYNYFENINLIFKYLYLFFIAMYLQSYNVDTEKIILFFEKLFLINAVLVFVGFLGDVQFLRLRPDEEYRWGYTGLLASAGNESAYLTILSLLLFYFRTFVLKEKNIVFFLIILAASLLSGQKAVYGAIGLLLMYHVGNNLFGLSWKAILSNIVIVSTAIEGVIYFISSESFEKYFSYFLYTTDKYGLMTMLMGGRDVILINEFLAVTSSWGGYAFLFGGRDHAVYTMELDFIDIFLSLGVIGTVLYFYLFYVYFIYKKEGLFYYFFLGLILLAAATSGHFFTSAVVALYFAIIAKYISNSLRSKKYHGGPRNDHHKN